ncbi:MAG: hypothetical protein ACJ760_07585 [Thermoleophilaceae bacterium]
MTPLLAIVLAAGLVLALGSAWGFVAIVSRATREQLRGLPPRDRRRALAGGAAVAVWILAASALVIAAPWGRRTLLYVFGGAALAVLALVLGVAILELARRRDPR